MSCSFHFQEINTPKKGRIFLDDFARDFLLWHIHDLWVWGKNGPIVHFLDASYVQGVRFLRIERFYSKNKKFTSESGKLFRNVL